MELRDATAADVASIREVARASLRASYGHAVDEAILEGAVERWYDTDDLSEEVDDPATRFVVAVDDGAVVAFTEVYVVDRRERVGEIDWLHVHPDHRGRGIGSDLLARIEGELREAAVDAIEGRVLAENETGAEFYEREGYERAGDREVDVGEKTFEERIYRKRLADEPTGGPTAARRETDDGETIHVAFGESERGSSAPFYAAYSDDAHQRRYGYFCGACESTNVAIDTMDAVECLECGNRRKPARWDAAY